MIQWNEPVFGGRLLHLTIEKIAAEEKLGPHGSVLNALEELEYNENL